MASNDIVQWLSEHWGILASMLCVLVILLFLMPWLRKQGYIDDSGKVVIPRTSLDQLPLLPGERWLFDDGMHTVVSRVGTLGMATTHSGWTARVTDQRIILCEPAPVGQPLVHQVFQYAGAPNIVAHRLHKADALAQGYGSTRIDRQNIRASYDQGHCRVTLDYWTSTAGGSHAQAKTVLTPVNHPAAWAQQFRGC